jgi:hypothetical protein
MLLKDSKKIKSLYLEHLNLDADDMIALSQLSSLRYADLKDNPGITYGALQQLKSKRLEFLNLEGSAVDVRALPVLKQMKLLGPLSDVLLEYAFARP